MSICEFAFFSQNGEKQTCCTAYSLPAFDPTYTSRSILPTVLILINAHALMNILASFPRCLKSPKVYKYNFRFSVNCTKTTKARGYKTFSMLISAEHEILNAHKY